VGSSLQGRRRKRRRCPLWASFFSCWNADDRHNFS
jgi:hypothetical protein